MFPSHYVYFAKSSHLAELCSELGSPYEVFGDLVLSPHKKTDVCFAQDIWLDPVIMTIPSIGAAAKKLREYPVFWQEYRFQSVRRTLLIKEQLRAYKPRILKFPHTEALPQVGIFTLLNDNTLLFATRFWKPFPLGECNFQEDKVNPPNRAYLKLWEALTLQQSYPGANDVVMDLGASPGGWTYVAESLGCNVIAVDKAPLASAIAGLPRVKSLQQSAFSLRPQDFPEVTWLVADIACYPERLLRLVQQWIEHGRLQQMICTIKLQGEADFDALKEFQAIPGARVLQLFHNKNEVTFFWRAADALLIRDMQPLADVINL